MTAKAMTSNRNRLSLPLRHFPLLRTIAAIAVLGLAQPVRAEILAARPDRSVAQTTEPEIDPASPGAESSTESSDRTRASQDGWPKTLTAQLESEPPTQTTQPGSESPIESPINPPIESDLRPTQPEPVRPQPLRSEAGEPPLTIPAVQSLSDVEPGHWALGALQALNDRYGCLVGEGDGRFRGDRSLTRFEFAAAVTACLDRLQADLKSRRDRFLSQDDALLIQRLQNEFGAELSQTRRRIADLSDRVQFLRDRQFAPMTVLGGEVVFGLAGATADHPPGQNQDTSIVFTHLTRLQLVSSFSGKDRLRLQLSTGNFANDGFAGRQALGTDMARLAYQTNLDNKLNLDLLDYRVAAFGDRAVLIFRPVGFDLSSVLTANSPFFDTGRGALSRFAEASPVFKLGALDAGLGFDGLLTDKLRLQFAYGTRTSADPSQGITGADHSAIGVQLLVKPAPHILAGLAYVNAYAADGRLDTFTGSLNADLSGGLGSPAQINAISGTLQWRFAENLTFATWGGWIWTDYIDRSASAEATTYAFSVALSDPFGRDGDVLALIFGQPPRLVAGTGGIQADRDTSFHIELFYRLKLNDHISITPGFFVITNPEHNADNSAIWVGTIRTTFRF